MPCLPPLSSPSSLDNSSKFPAPTHTSATSALSALFHHSAQSGRSLRISFPFRFSLPRLRSRFRALSYLGPSGHLCRIRKVRLPIPVPMDNGEAIGMMAGAYFVGRGQLLRWINDLTSLNYTKIEQTANGVFACHVFDALFPGELRLEKVNFNASKHYEFVHNYKVLQAAFNRLNLKKHIDVEKLIKGKYQDNLEFIQWVKAFYDSHASEDALQYDGRARREAIMSKTGTTMRPALAPNRPRPTDRPRPTAYAPPPRAGKAKSVGSERTARLAGPVVKKAKFDRVQDENEVLKDENEKLQQEAADNETERAFYFNKLRNVELIIQDLEEEFGSKEIDGNFARALDQIKNVLYAEDDVDPAAEPHPEDEQTYDENADLLPEEAAHGDILDANGGM